MTDDESLRIFLTAAKTGSLTVASRVLNVSQPTVTKKLQRLESAMGGDLFRRHGRGVALTQLGVALKREVEPLYLKIDNAIQTLATPEDELSGFVRIASVHTLNGYFIPSLISSFSRSYPNIHLQMMGRSSEDVIALVETGEADIGFVYDVMVTSDQLEIVHLHTETMALYHHPNLRALLDDDGNAIINEDFPLVGFQQGFALQRVLDRYYGGRANIIVQVETFDVLIEAVKRQVAGAILPAELPDAQVEQYGLIRTPLSGAKIQRKVVMISRPNDYLSTHVVKSKEVSLQIFDELASLAKP